jgi:hypothetical protein
MKKKISLSFVIGVFLALGVSFSSFAQVPTFPYCTDTPEYCQKKVAQVPLPWQFWAIITDPTGTTVIDRIRISPTWLTPPDGLPAGSGVITVQRQFAIAPDPIPLEDLVLDFGVVPPKPVPNRPDLQWQMVEEDQKIPPEVKEGEDVELEISLEGVTEHMPAVLVYYKVFHQKEDSAPPVLVGHFFNEAIVELNNQTNTESSSSPLIVEVRVNFDIHNETGIDVTNFELDFAGLDFGCEDVKSAIGFVAAEGTPPLPPTNPGIWGANESSPLVVRPIKIGDKNGTEVKWIQPDRPLKTCEWLHIGLSIDCTAFDCFIDPDDLTLRATVQGYLTTIEPEICDPRTQGFWRRICDGETGEKKTHPETAADFDTDMWLALQIKGKERRDPCVRAEAQYAALWHNLNHGYLSECCEVVFEGKQMSVAEALEKVRQLIDSGECKAAADLAEAINSGDALTSDS